MGGGSDLHCYPPCTCQAQLDLLNKFHHLDREQVMGKHVQEEIHHCNMNAEGTKAYIIKHCGCHYKTRCLNCIRLNECAARVVHAIDAQETTLGMHLAFVGSSKECDFKNSLVSVGFSEECPKNKGWYHIITKKCVAKWSAQEEFIKLRQDYQDCMQARQECVQEAEWARRMKVKIKRELDYAE